MEKKWKGEIKKLSNSEFPPDNIIQVILSKVPLFNLTSCRLVCKSWNNLVLTCKFDPSLFISLAYDCPSRTLYCVDFDPMYSEGMNSVGSFSFHPKFSTSSSSISIINACNGLLSLLISKRKPGSVSYVLGILNPMTNEYFKFPAEKSKSHCCCGRLYSYGLGFNPKKKQYKIARTSFRPDESTTLVEIFAFGSTYQVWTSVGFLPSLVVEDHGVYFNGGLYWVANQPDPHDSSISTIYRLDIENENLEKISCPQHLGGHFFFGVFDGTLYLTVSKNNKYQVWKMKDNFSWIKAFVISSPRNLCHPDHPHQPWGVSQLDPIKACEDGKILCLLAGLHLILYDPKTKSAEILTDQSVKVEKHLHVHHIDSFNFNSLPNILAGNS
ncbi:hypothetical protein IC582_017974 [Cucumis melo]|uniref:Putative F-box protein n=1 Tax=Cucumis melo var. makuwa TaxID=1194695 RepID=A0A5D3CM94_CUCMM|nr:putative F-box protein [Cucumis melo var. makuwa]